MKQEVILSPLSVQFPSSIESFSNTDLENMLPSDIDASDPSSREY